MNAAKSMMMMGQPAGFPMNMMAGGGGLTPEMLQQIGQGGIMPPGMQISQQTQQQAQQQSQSQQPQSQTQTQSQTQSQPQPQGMQIPSQLRGPGGGMPSGFASLAGMGAPPGQGQGQARMSQ